MENEFDNLDIDDQYQKDEDLYNENLRDLLKGCECCEGFQ